MLVNMFCIMYIADHRICCYYGTVLLILRLND